MVGKGWMLQNIGYINVGIVCRFVIMIHAVWEGRFILLEKVKLNFSFSMLCILSLILMWSCTCGLCVLLRLRYESFNAGNLV